MDQMIGFEPTKKEQIKEQLPTELKETES